MLSICITIKNRSHIKTNHGIIQPFPTLINSINSSYPFSDDIELVISDWKSDDYPLIDWIDDELHPDIPINLITIDCEGFSRGKGLNICADHSGGNLLFFCDSDMVLNKEAVNRGILEASKHNVFYPVALYEQEKNGKVIIHEGGGNFFIHKKEFYNVGGWPEYWEWGFEDVAMNTALKKYEYNIITDEKISIFHPWHPQDKEFKNKYSLKKDENVVKYREETITKIQKEEDMLKRAIENFVTTNPCTTHQQLNKPVKGTNQNIRWGLK